MYSLSPLDSFMANFINATTQLEVKTLLENGATGTGAVSITSGKQYYFACSTIASGGTKVFSANFGNGYFGTTAVSSAGTNASNNGIFEYDVPTGYTALSTKGLNL